LPNLKTAYKRLKGKSTQHNSVKLKRKYSDFTTSTVTYSFNYNRVLFALQLLTHTDSKTSTCHCECKLPFSTVECWI